MSMNIWLFIMEFIRQREPVFLSQIKGLSDNDIAGLPASLPASYVEFLRCMGINSNGYSVFGSTYDHRFVAITEHLSEYDEDSPPSDRYFPVAIETDESLVSLENIYLDLKRSDGEDAPLVVLEWGVPFNWQIPKETSDTFNERIVWSVFNRFQLSSCREQHVLAMGGTLSPGEGRIALQQVLTLLQNMGFEAVLPLLGRVACLQSGSISILARVNEESELLTILLGNNDAKALSKLADQLLAGLPGARRPHYQK